MVVMDQFTRRIIGFDVHRGSLGGVALCRMFQRAVGRAAFLNTSDHDPLYGFHHWTTIDLEAKLVDFQHYFNAYRTHAGLEGRLPEPSIHGSASAIDFGSYRWRTHCRGLYQTPIAA